MSNLQKILYAISQQCQDIQTQENLLNEFRNLNTAQGVQLEGTVIQNGHNVLVGLGTILGLDRVAGPDDDTIIDGKQVTGYRQDLQFQIFLNNSQGTPEEVIYVLKYLTKASQIWYNEVYPAGYQMATDGLTFTPFPSDFVGAIQKVSPAGVNFLNIRPSITAILFRSQVTRLLSNFMLHPIPTILLLLIHCKSILGLVLKIYIFKKG